MLDAIAEGDDGLEDLAGSLAIVDFFLLGKLCVGHKARRLPGVVVAPRARSNCCTLRVTTLTSLPSAIVASIDWPFAGLATESQKKSVITGSVSSQVTWRGTALRVNSYISLILSRSGSPPWPKPFLNS